MIEYALPTTIGELTIGANGVNHIYTRGYVTVRGKQQSISIHAYKWANGQWNLGLESEQSYTRSHSLHVDGHSGGTPAFRNKVLDVVMPAINEWAKTHQEALNVAADEDRQAGIADRNDRIKAHQEAIDALNAELAQIAAGVVLSQCSKIK